MKIRNYFLSILTMYLLLAGNLLAQKAVQLTPLWKTDVKSFLENSPVLAHLTGSDESQVIVAGREDLIALDSNGGELWRYRSSGRYMMSPSVLEIKGKSTLIFTSDNSGNLRCHNSKGRVVWETKLAAATSWSAPILTDLNEDGHYLVIQGDESGAIYAFDALTGKPVWKTVIKGKPSGGAVGDLDGQKGLEIAYLTTDGFLTVLHSDGSPYWEQNIGGTSQTWGTAAPVIFVAADGSPRIFAASNDGDAYAFAGSGKQLWKKSVKGAVAATLSAGDIDQDGVADLFLITQLGVIYRFTENGQLLWNIDMQGRTLGSGSIIDLNGDGKLEYIFCTQDGHLQALDLHGTPVFDYNFGHRTINATPAFGQVSKKSAGLEMVIAGGESGLVYCFRSSAPDQAKQQWTTYGGNEKKQNFRGGLVSSSQLSMIPIHLNWNELYLGEDICFDLYNPNSTDELISAEASCTHPDGKYQSVTSKLAGHHSQIFLPFNGLAPGNYHFKWSLSSPTGKLLLAGERDINLTPFLNEKNIVQASLHHLKEMSDLALSKRPDLAESLSQEAAAIDRQSEQLQPLQELSLAGNQPEKFDIVEMSAALTRKAKKAIQVAELADASLNLASNTTLLPFEGELWESRMREDALPVKAELKIALSRTMVTGENEPVSLNLFNLLGREITARIVTDSLPAGFRITLQHAVPTVDGLGKLAWDALPEMDESSTLSIPSRSSKEIWINILCAPTIKSGHYKIPIVIQALNGAEVLNGPKSPQSVAAPVVRVEINLEVLNFKMAPKGTLRLCAWGNYDAASIRDLLDHENTVFIVPQGKSTGNSTLYDFSDQNKIVDELKGNDAFVLISGIPDMISEEHMDQTSEKLNTYLEKLTEHLASKGVDKKHFAFYPYDEPGGTGWTLVNKVVDFAKLVKAKDPELLVYVDGGGEAPMFKSMQPYVDIWCLGYNVLPEKSPVMDIVRKDPGGALWTYDCSYSYARPVGPNIKNINLVGQYRISALAAFRWNATGIGYWSYNLGDDLWGRVALEYPLVYKGITKPIDSRRWEAVRESVEDYRILVSIKALLDDKSANIRPETRKKADQLFRNLTSLIDQSDKEMKMGMSRAVMDVTNSEEAIRQLRKELMECVKSFANE